MHISQRLGDRVSVPAYIPNVEENGFSRLNASHSWHLTLITLIWAAGACIMVIRHCQVGDHQVRVICYASAHLQWKKALCFWSVFSWVSTYVCPKSLWVWYLSSTWSDGFSSNLTLLFTMKAIWTDKMIKVMRSWGQGHTGSDMKNLWSWYLHSELMDFHQTWHGTRQEG